MLDPHPWIVALMFCICVLVFEGIAAFRRKSPDPPDEDEIDQLFN